MTDIHTRSAPVNGTSEKFRLHAKVHSDRRLTVADVCVAYFLIDRFNSNKGHAWPSQATLAALTGLSVRTVKRAVARLAAFGIITIKTRGRPGRSSQYVPNFGYGDSTDINPDPDGDSADTNMVTELCPQHGDRALSPNPLPSRSDNEGMVRGPAERGLAPDGARRASGADAHASDGAAPDDGDAAALEFEAFWDAYPRKEGRAAAKKAFAAVRRRGVPLDILVSKARQYAAAKAHLADPKYIKRPANWLIEECWLEDPQPPGLKAPKPERAPRASKDGAAKPVEPVEPVEPDDDEDEYETPEQAIPIGSCVWNMSNGRKGEVLSVRDIDDGPYMVEVQWESGSISSTPADHLAFEDPLTPEERAAAAAAEAARVRRRELQDRFPVGTFVRHATSGAHGRVTALTPSNEVEVDWWPDGPAMTQDQLCVGTPVWHKGGLAAKWSAYSAITSLSTLTGWRVLT
jgi:hypothetical protein